MNIKTLISEEDLQRKVKEIGEQITEEYMNQEIVIVCVLTGAVYFTTDLTKYIKNHNLMLGFIKVSSYGNGKESSGELKIEKDLGIEIKGKNVIIVEDIIDTGLTMNALKKYLSAKEPKSLKVCALLDKRERRRVEITPDYVGFEVPNKFILGYGLDYEEHYRNLPFIAYTEE